MRSTYQSHAWVADRYWKQVAQSKLAGAVSEIGNGLENGSIRWKAAYWLHTSSIKKTVISIPSDFQGRTMSQGRSSLTPTSAVHHHTRSNSVPHNTLQLPRKTSRERPFFDSMAAQSASDLEDGRLLVLKVIGKVKLRIERKDYQELIRIINQLPGDVLVLIVDNLSLEELYADIPSSLACLAVIYWKIFYDRRGKCLEHDLRTDDFVHHLVRYFVDVLKFNNQTFASARSREHIKTIFSICAQVDDSLHARLARRVARISKVLQGFSTHALVETITRSSATYRMKMHEALKVEIERAASHYKSALQKVSDVLLKVSHESVDFTIQTPGSKQSDVDERTVQYMRKLSSRVIEDRLFFNQSLLNAVEVPSRDKLMVNCLIEKLESRIHHDKEVRNARFVLINLQVNSLSPSGCFEDECKSTCAQRHGKKIKTN